MKLLFWALAIILTTSNSFAADEPLELANVTGRGERKEICSYVVLKTNNLITVTLESGTQEIAFKLNAESYKLGVIEPSEPEKVVLTFEHGDINYLHIDDEFSFIRVSLRNNDLLDPNITVVFKGDASFSCLF